MQIEQPQAFVSAEVETFWTYINSSICRLVAIAEELPLPGLNWHPPAVGANSVGALVVHVCGNAEENLIGTLCGRGVTRDRASEFAGHPVFTSDLVTGWAALQARLIQELAALPSERLDESLHHPRRGTRCGRDVLIVVARHAAEHLGQAELTRDLWFSTQI